METRQSLVELCNGGPSNFNSFVHSAVAILKHTVRRFRIQIITDAGSQKMQLTHQHESAQFKLEHRFARLNHIVNVHLAAPVEDRYFLVVPVDVEDGSKRPSAVNFKSA